MPFISIKGYPKDEDTQKRIIARICDVFVEEWGCPKEAVSISISAVSPENWEFFKKKEILSDEDIKMLDGEIYFKK